MARLEQMIETALNLMSADGITGWGLVLLDSRLEELGSLHAIGEPVGCTTETCNHWSHDPAAPQRKWVPCEGTLIKLGESDDRDGTSTYYCLRLEEEDVFLCLHEPRSFWSELRIVEPDCVPAYILLHIRNAAPHHEREPT